MAQTTAKYYNIYLLVTAVTLLIVRCAIFGQIVWKIQLKTLTITVFENKM